MAKSRAYNINISPEFRERIEKALHRDRERREERRRTLRDAINADMRACERGERTDSCIRAAINQIVMRNLDDEEFCIGRFVEDL